MIRLSGILSGAALAAVLVSGCSQPNSPGGQQQAAAPQVQCTTQRVVHKEEWGTGGVAGTVIGGAAGGLLGNQFGKGSGNAAMTAAGAAGGAVAGHEIGKDQDSRVSYVEHCRDVSPN
jgi:uncharacterized protein YcfJ